MGHIAKGCAKPKTDVKGQAKGKGKGKGKGRGKGKGKGKGKDKEKEEEDSTKPRWSFCAISVEEEGAQIENYKKVVKRSGSVNDCSEVHAEYQDAKNNRSEETAKASKVLSTDDIKPEGLVSSDDRDCEHLMEFVNGNKRSPTGTSDRNLHLITTIDKDDLRVCFFSEENVEMVLDSASTEHIFNINECFFTSIEPSRASVLTGGGKITAVAKGNVELFLTNEDDEEDRVEIRDCLRIPNMPVN